MNIEKICSPFANLEHVIEALESSHPDFKRGVFDMCVAFDLTVDVLSGSSRNDVTLLTTAGWPAGRLLHVSKWTPTGDVPYFKYVSSKINKFRSDERTDRHSRAANKIKDLIKVLRMKKEMMTNDDAFEFEKRGVLYAYSCVEHHVAAAPKPEVIFKFETAEAFMRAALGECELPEALRQDVLQAREKFNEEHDKYVEATDVLNRFNRSSTVVGIFNHWGKPNYYVGRVGFAKGKFTGTEITVQTPLKRYLSLADTELAADAAIIRTYMQGQSRYDENNELGMSKQDTFFSEMDVATGYSADSMLWVVMPSRD